MVEVRCFWVTFKSFKMLGKVSTILLRLSEVWFGRSGQLVQKNTAKQNTHSRVAYIFQSPPSSLLLLAKVLAEAMLNKTCVYSAIH